MKMKHPERRLSSVKFSWIAASICTEVSVPNGSHRCLDNGFFKSGLAIRQSIKTEGPGHLSTMIWRANFPDNSAMAETADFLPGANNLSNVAFDDTAHPNLPTKNLEGSIGPLKQMSSGAMLWHEVIGHGVLWANPIKGKDGHHRKVPWNTQALGSGSPQSDATIDIENPYRCWTGEPLRYGKYYRDAAYNSSPAPASP